MSLRVATAIIEPDMLIREGLATILERHSYCVIGHASSADDFATADLSEPPKLVLVGAKTIDEALAEADNSHRLWPATKIVLLLLPGGADDVGKALASQISGYMSRSVSPSTLIQTVDLVMLETAKIQIIIWPLWPGRHPSNSEGELPQLQKKPHGGDDNGSAPVAPTASATLTSINSGRDAVDLAAGSRRQPSERRLSVRESQILEIMVSGDSNKMVARKCGITEATVKVHVKSIMRKIQVTNRTQAAVWAMENSSTPRANKRLREVDTDDAA